MACETLVYDVTCVGEVGGDGKAPFDICVNASLLWQAEEEMGARQGS